MGILKKVINEIQINETPDIVRIDNKMLSISSDSVAFLYADDVLRTKNGGTHLEILADLAEDKNVGIYDIVNTYGSRNSGNYPGRLWLADKIISFWEYPPEDVFKKLINDLEKKLSIKIDDSWKIEIQKRKFKPNELSDDWEFGKDREIFIPIDKYNPKISNTRNVKKGKSLSVSKNSAMSAKKIPKGMTQAEYNALKTKYSFTESEIKEFVNDLNIENFLRRSILMREEKLKTFIDKFEVTKDSVIYKDNPDILIHKDAYSDLEQNLKSIINTNTMGIFGKVSLSNYNKQKDTIEVDGHEMPVIDFKRMIRVLNHTFG